MRVGPVYTLEDGSRWQDLDLGCPHCGKRLAEVIHDPFAQWNPGQVVCIDCGLEVTSQPAHVFTAKPSYVAPGRWVAACSCRWTSMPTSRAGALEQGDAHVKRAAA